MKISLVFMFLVLQMNAVLAADKCAGINKELYPYDYQTCLGKQAGKNADRRECGVSDQQEVSQEAADKMLEDSKEEFKDYVTGAWYGDWENQGDNYVPVYNKNDRTKAQLVKVKLSSTCGVEKVEKANNDGLLKYLMQSTPEIKKVANANCESVNDQTAVCEGNLYKRDKSVDESLKRDVKKIETQIDQSKTSTSKSTSGK